MFLHVGANMVPTFNKKTQIHLTHSTRVTLKNESRRLCFQFIHPVHSKKQKNAQRTVACIHTNVRSLPSPRPASEYSSPSGRPLSCVVDENTPVMTPVNGAEASGPPGEQRIQERRVRSQRHRNYMSRTHLHSPPDLPEGYGERHR